MTNQRLLVDDEKTFLNSLEKALEHISEFLELGAKILETIDKINQNNKEDSKKNNVKGKEIEVNLEKEMFGGGIAMTRVDRGVGSDAGPVKTLWEHQKIETKRMRERY